MLIYLLMVGPVLGPNRFKRYRTGPYKLHPLLIVNIRTHSQAATYDNTLGYIPVLRQWTHRYGTQASTHNNTGYICTHASMDTYILRQLHMHNNWQIPAVQANYLTKIVELVLS